MAHQQAMRTSRVWLPAIAFTVIAAVVVARLVQIQVLEHDRYAEEARSELFTSDTVFERRGAILDRNGFLLAMSTDTWDLYVASRVWNDDTTAREASEAISEATGHDATTSARWCGRAGSSTCWWRETFPTTRGKPCSTRTSRG